MPCTRAAAAGCSCVELRTREGRARPQRVLLTARISPSAYAHAGGQLVFGPGGRLPVALGDGLDPAAAQDPESMLGKVLRVDVDSSIRHRWSRSASATRGRLSFDRLDRRSLHR